MSAFPVLRPFISTGQTCLSYEGLDRLPSLKSINCTEEQKNAIMEAYPDNDFIFLV